MIVALILIATLAVATLLFLQQAQFGKKPAGARLEAIQNSPNCKDGQFQNLSPTPNFSEDHSMPGVMWEFLFGKSSRAKPVNTIPSVKTDLHKLAPDSNVLVWFGHSSYFMQVAGKRILPVHSSKFSLALHAWDEPLAKITALNSSFKIPLLTPIIGEPVNLDNANQVFTQWWQGLE